MHVGKDYWKNYMDRWFGRDLIKRWEEAVQLKTLQSNDRTIQLEVYDTGNKEAPTIVFAHGIAGYARVLLPFLVPLFERGYNIIAPDLQGYGYNSGKKGDFEWNAHKQNMKDVLAYAKQQFCGPIVAGGASMGGPIAYATTCESEIVDALICWCLWDFSDREFIVKETNTKQWTYILKPFMNGLSKLLGQATMKTYRLISYDTLTNSPEFNDLLKKDPQAGTRITIKGACSLILQSKPALPHHAFTIPVLVVQPGADEMTPSSYSKNTFEQLASPIKQYVELEGAGHFPIEPIYYERWVHVVDDFLKRVF